MRGIRKVILVSALALLALSSNARAGVYGDELGKCLVESSTGRDKVALAKWVFVAISAHSEVKALSAVTDADREAATRAFADIVTRLLTVDCREKTKKAFRYEGAQAFQTSFALLGQVAMQYLFEDANVANSLSEFEKHMDSEKIKQLATATEESGNKD